jgi:hypothetical protein
MGGTREGRREKGEGSGYLKIKITGKGSADRIENRFIFCKMGSMSEFFF